MSFSVRTKVEVTGDKHMLERASNALRNRGKVLMERVIRLGLSAAEQRLRDQIAARPDNLSSGRLPASLRPGKEGNIFDVTDYFASAGSNVVYAAQRHFGGRIVPKNAKALAIPLIERLRKDGISPLEIDPNRELFDFVPGSGAKGVIGYLVNPEDDEDKKPPGGNPPQS